ncbi:hypothetical protein XBLMG947_1893 [Xanthomonas bromi]|uniref:Uncharacterized protein n=1 Tax=Xanthomonas bromi TaxID=56449 RepID=A0A1C3NL43_9XANT|nr:hypothetical protein XBLMG947_1893 [Xanthomonas bromi]
MASGRAELVDEARIERASGKHGTLATGALA